jgi:DNA polymerase-3 subunit alpha
MSGNTFCHTHVHSEFSMLDGASRVDDIVQSAVDDGQPAISITDHGNLYGVVPFYKAAKKAGINPVIGTEAYMAHDNRFERLRVRGKQDDLGGDVGEKRKLYYHIILLAENNTGYKNLIQLASRAFLEGWYYRPKVDWEILAEHSEGIIATTGCLGGHVLQSLLNDNFDEAYEKAGRLQEIFGRDNLFVEIQDHGIAEQKKTNPQLVEIAKGLKAPLLATNDSHYTRPEDADAHDALICVQTNSLISQTEEERFKFKGSGHYLKTSEEMRRLFSDYEGACDNSVWIGERANVELEFGNPQLPVFPIPERFKTESEYLKTLTLNGAKKRWGDQLTDEIIDRIMYELQVIDNMGFSVYFLIVWDIIKYAREHEIRVGPGRGSAGGCAVAYCLGITNLDPIKYDLLFERFLNPSRVSMPDIDMDFDSRYRDELIQYVTSKYGRDHVAQIITFTSIGARQAVRDSTRVLGLPYGLGDKLSKAMPPLIAGRNTPLSACMARSAPQGNEAGWSMAHDLRQIVAADPDAQKIIDIAMGLEGLRRQDGIHAAAVVITRDKLTEYLPIQQKVGPGQKPENVPIVTQYEMHTVEELGLLKMDFLALRNLDVISDTIKLVEETTGTKLDMNKIPLDDSKTFGLLQKAQTIGVFQLEGVQMRHLISRLAPTSLDDVAALVALYRPGPMADNMHYDFADRKNGRQKIKYLHPDAREILDDTYGLMIYQEKLMRIAQKFAGYSLAEADLLRKACGKKIREVMAKEREKFVEGCVKTGYGPEIGKQWFDIIEPFADYAFPKAHAYGYGLISYQTAYLKANYPAEYFSALLTSVGDSLDKASVYLAECRNMGISVLVPDINLSQEGFRPIGSSILFGLSAVRNIGSGFAEWIVNDRKVNGPYKDFKDVLNRAKMNVLNKKNIEALIKAGAFDSMGYKRKGLMQSYEPLVDATFFRRKKEAVGQFDLFSGLDEPDAGMTLPEISDVEYSKKLKLSHEREMLGLYVSDHPLFGLEDLLVENSDCTIEELNEEPDGSFYKICGLISNLVKKRTKKGDVMATFTLEDLVSSMKVVVFPRLMQQMGADFKNDAVVIVNGKLDKRDEETQIMAQGIKILDLDSEKELQTI